MTTDISLNGCEFFKNYVEKRMFKMFWTDDEVLMEYKDTDQNISVRSLTLSIFAVSRVGIVWSTTTRTRVCDATAVTFSVKHLTHYKLKLYSLPGNIFRKWFASYFLFIHEHLIIM